MSEMEKKSIKNQSDSDIKFYAFVWITFAIAAFLCTIFMFVSGLGICFMAAGLAVLLYDFVYFRRIRFMTFWLIVLGGFMSIPVFYAWFLRLFSKIYSGDDYMQVNIFFAIVWYAFLSVVDGSVDFMMRRIRCKHRVRAYAYEKNFVGTNANGKHVNKSYTVVTYDYNGKRYKIKAGNIVEERGTIGRMTDIYIDKNCPAYARTGVIQGQNIASIIRGAVIIWLIVVIILNG